MYRLRVVLVVMPCPRGYALGIMPSLTVGVILGVVFVVLLLLWYIQVSGPQFLQSAQQQYSYYMRQKLACKFIPLFRWKLLTRSFTRTRIGELSVGT